MRKKKRDLVTPPWRKLWVDSSAYGNQKRDHLLQYKLSNILIANWKSSKLSTSRIVQPLKDCKIVMYTDDRWWVIGKVVGGEVCEVKVRDASAILTRRCSCTVIYWSCVWSKNATSLNYSRVRLCFWWGEIAIWDNEVKGLIFVNK